jgi:hypothetical protein
MTMSSVEIEELEEQLILIYRFVSQNNRLKRFYYQGVETKPSFEDDTGILNELVQHEDAEEILKNSVLELEEMKHGLEDIPEFHEILDSYDTEVLYHKYGMDGVEDVGKLDLKKIISSL